MKRATFTSTSERAFTVAELLVGLAVTVVLVLALAPVWVGLERRGVLWNERMIVSLQMRVAAARLERDLRMASAEGCAGLTAPALLKASPRELIIVTRSAASGQPEIVEWEFAENGLMRRRLPWPGYLPHPIGHQIYIDHKTMLEGVEEGTSFHYRCDGIDLGGSPALDMLGRVDGVVVSGWVRVPGAVRPAGGEVASESPRVSTGRAGSVALVWTAAVGR